MPIIAACNLSVCPLPLVMTGPLTGQRRSHSHLSSRTADAEGSPRARFASRFVCGPFRRAPLGSSVRQVMLRITLAHGFKAPCVQCMDRGPGPLNSRSQRSHVHRFIHCAQPFLWQCPPNERKLSNVSPQASHWKLGHVSAQRLRGSVGSLGRPAGVSGRPAGVSGCACRRGIRLRISLAQGFTDPFVQCWARLPGPLKTRSQRSHVHCFFACRQPLLRQCQANVRKLSKASPQASHWKLWHVSAHTRGSMGPPLVGGSVESSPFPCSLGALGGGGNRLPPWPAGRPRATDGAARARRRRQRRPASGRKSFGEGPAAAAPPARTPEPPSRSDAPPPLRGRRARLGAAAAAAAAAAPSRPRHRTPRGPRRLRESAASPRSF